MASVCAELSRSTVLLDVDVVDVSNRYFVLRLAFCIAIRCNVIKTTVFAKYRGYTYWATAAIV